MPARDTCCPPCWSTPPAVWDAPEVIAEPALEAVLRAELAVLLAVLFALDAVLLAVLLAFFFALLNQLAWPAHGIPNNNPMTTANIFRIMFPSLPNVQFKAIYIK